MDVWPPGSGVRRTVLRPHRQVHQQWELEGQGAQRGGRQQHLDLSYRQSDDVRPGLPSSAQSSTSTGDEPTQLLGAESVRGLQTGNTRRLLEYCRYRELES